MSQLSDFLALTANICPPRADPRSRPAGAAWRTRQQAVVRRSCENVSCQRFLSVDFQMDYCLKSML